MPYSAESGGCSGPRLSERGGTRLKTLVTLAIVFSMGFGAFKIIPPYFANYQFQDSIETESRFALTGYPKRNQDDIQDEVYKKAQDLGLPVTRDDIHVDMTGTTCDISLDYSVPIDLMVYQFVVPFHDHADNHTI